MPLLNDFLKAGRNVFLSPEYLPLIPLTYKAQIPSTNECASALVGTDGFYRMNRERHFGAILLSANPGSLPLATALLESQRWELTDVSPFGFLIIPRRHIEDSCPPTNSWTPPDPGTLASLLPSEDSRARWLIATAANLIAIKRMNDAETLLKSAAVLGKERSCLLGTEASLAASRDRWEEAAVLSAEAVKRNPSNISAREILIRSLTESGHPDEALDEARRLARQCRDTETLFLLARAANAANSWNEEISALQGLVDLGKKHNLPLGASLTYLGQALAKDGQRGAALRAFRAALDSPELSEEQRQMIRQLADHITAENTPDRSPR